MTRLIELLRKELAFLAHALADLNSDRAHWRGVRMTKR